MVTRKRAQASDLVARLGELGAEVIESPAIEIVDPADGGEALRAAVGAIGTYDWLVLTSPNGVHRTFAHVPDARALAGVRVAAIGPGTAAALASYRVVADVVPERFVAESLLAALPTPPPDGGRVLLARAAVARDVLPDGLRDAGWEVDVVGAYRTLPLVPSGDVLDAISGADAITFTSSSTVSNFCGAIGAERVPGLVVSIGPITSGTARARGIDVAAEAEEHTIDGLVGALVGALTTS